MNRRNTKKDRKQPTNLTLSKDAIRMGNTLKKDLNRPSLSNVVEFLIEEKAKALGVAA